MRCTRSKNGPTSDELGQRHDVLGRHDEHVAGEQRRAVEEGHGDVVAVHDLGRRRHRRRWRRTRSPSHRRIASSAIARTVLLGAEGVRCSISRRHPPSDRRRCDTTGSRWVPAPRSTPSPLAGQGVALTDRLPAAAVSIGGERSTSSRTRVVLDTSVLIADPSCVTSFDDVDVVIPLIVVEELDGLKTRPDDVGRAARTALRTIEDLRVRHGGSLAEPVPVGDGRHACRSRSTASRSTSSSSTGSIPTAPTTASSAPPSDRPSAAPRRCCPTTPRCASRRPTSASPPPSTCRRGDRCRRRPTGWSTIETTHEIVDCLYAAGAVDAEAVDGAERRRRERVRRAALRLAVGADATRRRRARPAVAHGARGVGPAGALEGAALRPRAAARPGDRGRRPRRPGRHGQDAARRRRRPRAGRRAEPLRAPRRSTARSCRSAGPTSGSCPAVSTRSSTRGWRRSTTPSSPSPTTDRTPTPAT